MRSPKGAIQMLYMRHTNLLMTKLFNQLGDVYKLSTHIYKQIFKFFVYRIT